MRPQMARLIATWFGVGLAPLAPGTVASLVALPIAWGLITLSGGLGLALATALVFGLGALAAGTYAAGFVLFRVYDIVKPWPANRIDRHVHGGLGIMLDDIVAAVYAGATLWVAARLVT